MKKAEQTEDLSSRSSYKGSGVYLINGNFTRFYRGLEPMPIYTVTTEVCVSHGFGLAFLAVKVRFQDCQVFDLLYVFFAVFVALLFYFC